MPIMDNSTLIIHRMDKIITLSWSRRVFIVHSIFQNKAWSICQIVIFLNCTCHSELWSFRISVTVNFHHYEILPLQISVTPKFCPTFFSLNFRHSKFLLLQSSIFLNFRHYLRHWKFHWLWILVILILRPFFLKFPSLQISV